MTRFEIPTRAFICEVARAPRMQPEHTSFTSKLICEREKICSFRNAGFCGRVALGCMHDLNRSSW